METKEVVHKNEQPMKVLLQKIKTGYSWEIHIQGKNIAEILPELRSSKRSLEKRIWGEVMASLAIPLYPDWQPQKAACPPGWSSPICSSTAINGELPDATAINRAGVHGGDDPIFFKSVR